MTKLSVLNMKSVMTVVALCLSGFAWSAESYEVIDLRVSKLTIYEKTSSAGRDSFEKAGEISKDEFKGPWPVLSSNAQKLEVKAGDKTFWIAKYQVKTNKPITVPADCGAIVTAHGPKIGSVRGLGEECKK